MRHLIKQKLLEKFSGVDFDVLVPPDDKMGDYSTNIAFVLATHPSRKATEGKEKEKKSPMIIGEELATDLQKDKDLAYVFEKIEAVKPGFVNFYLKDDFLRKKLGELAEDKDYGLNETMKGKIVMVEYTDPNPFKLFHIGHLMSNTIGEAIARLYEVSGARVLRANYQGDVGLHVAKAIWGILNRESRIKNQELKNYDMEQIGQAYAAGAKAYEEDENAKKEIEDINAKIYDRSDNDINELYDRGKKLSLEYFETIYKKLGTKFDRYFFESEAAQDGLKIVEQYPNVFIESDGAKVFKGEEYGLHTRVFVSSKGLPTYEAKELGVNKKKFEKDNPDLSVIVTGNEINEYFKVLLKVMELTMPEVAARTKHVSHGMLRLPGGKMSSRTGDVITADSLVEQTKSKLPESESEEAREKIAIGAIKYSILKQSPGHDIVFDFERSLSVKGDSAPYLQYTYARLQSIMEKSRWLRVPGLRVYLPNFLGRPLAHMFGLVSTQALTQNLDLNLIKKLLYFPEVVLDSLKLHSPSGLATYLYELASIANHYYETVEKLSDYTKRPERNARLLLVETTASILKKGLNLLGIEVPKRI